MSPERAKEGEEDLSVALSGLVFLGPPTQGFALGFCMPPLWGFSQKMRLPCRRQLFGENLSNFAGPRARRRGCLAGFLLDF